MTIDDVPFVLLIALGVVVTIGVMVHDFQKRKK
jgi:hypothetical protein